jgi:hypothetical protein
MQENLLLFLALMTAHLLGDFVLPTGTIEAGKAENRKRAFFSHGAVHYVLAYVTMALFVPELLARTKLHVLLFFLIALHLAVDLLEERALTKHLSRLAAFTIDQGLHLLLILVLVGLMARGAPEWLSSGYIWLRDHREQVLWLLTVYLATLFAGGYLIRVLLPMGETEDGAKGLSESQDSVEKGGMYIGWLERFVILTAVLARSPTLIGLILTAKSIVRFKKLDDDLFAEYYLLGTFLSLALALAGGLLLLRVLGSGIVVPLE